LFHSPNGVTERCVRIAPMPGATYSEDDLKTEAAYCAINLYAPTIAICPKTWSTSPGMIIYDISVGEFAGDRSGFERTACAKGKEAKALAKDQLAKFKPTMNAKGTSGTFSASPLLYYHLSRYFGADVGVPPAVWRSMDRKTHLSEVARPGLALSGHSHSSGMNHAGWRVFVDVDEDPREYLPTSELFTADGTAIYGALLDSPGSRYNSAVNGTRKSGWGKGQNLDFQETAPFLALRSTAPLKRAVQEGIEKALRDPQIRRDMGADVPPAQVAYWMSDIANIVLLDYIFSQQDRIGNIDYQAYWYWAEDGNIRYKRAYGRHTKADGAPETAIWLMRTRLNDNDAGGRIQYANFAKSTQMLEKMRHFPAVTYRKLLSLDSDLNLKGQLYDYVRNSFGLDEKQLKQFVDNTAMAADILRTRCENGELIFDLDPDALFLTGSAPAQRVSCGGAF
jgi:hypothetical protein